MIDHDLKSMAEDYADAMRKVGRLRLALLDAIHALDGVIDGDFSPNSGTIKNTLKRCNLAYENNK